MAADTFLSPDELRELTGYSRPHLQLKVLRDWGIEPFLDRRKGLVVARDVLVEAQRRASGLEAPAGRKGPRPRLERVK